MGSLFSRTLLKAFAGRGNTNNQKAHKASYIFPLSIRNVLHIAYVKSDVSDTSYVRQSTTFLLASNARAAERLAAMEERLAELGATPEA